MLEFIWIGLISYVWAVGMLMVACMLMGYAGLVGDVPVKRQRGAKPKYLFATEEAAMAHRSVTTRLKHGFHQAQAWVSSASMLIGHRLLSCRHLHLAHCEWWSLLLAEACKQICVCVDSECLSGCPPRLARIMRLCMVCHL